jgi:large repetitive protein
MKKITLLFFVVFFSVFSSAQLALEGFEGDTFPPAGWAVMDNGVGTVNSWVRTDVTANVYQGTWSAFMTRENIGLGNTSEDWLVTPQFTVPTNGQLRFFARSTLAGNQGTIYQIRISTNASQMAQGNYIIIQQYSEDDLSDPFGVYEEKVLGLAAFQGQEVYVAFVMQFTQLGTALSGDRWLLDNVEVVEQCLDPENLSVTGITQTEAILSWGNPGGATQFEVEVVEVPNTPTGTGILTNDNPVSTTALGLTLTENTQYQFYVRAICTASVSQWIGPLSFATQSPGQVCEAPINIGSLPYSTTDNTSNYGDNYNGSPGATGCNTTSGYLGGDDVFYAYTAPSNGVIQINMSPTATWSGLFVYNSCANVGVSCVAGVANSATTPRVIELPVVAGTTYYIVISTFPAPQNTGYTLTIQQVNCPPPSTLTANNITGTSANIAWANPAGATSWQYVVQNAGTGVPTGTGITTASNTANAITQTNAGVALTPATQYEYYVRADCNDGNFSAWAGPFVFLTTQVPATLNYFEGFEEAHGWSLNNGTQVNKWVVGTAVNNGGTSSLYISNDNGASNTFTINTTSVVHAFRDIQMPATVDQVSLSFDWRAVGEGCCDYVRVWVVPTTFAPTPGTLITAAASGGQQFGANFNLQANWVTQNFTINAAPFAGQIVRLVFEWRNDGSVGTQPPAAIDNINVSVITCPAPSGLALSSVTETSATFNWTGPTSVSASYDYFISTSSATPAPDATPTGNTSNTTVTINDLLPSTNYYFWVRSNCDADGTSFLIGPINFNTPQIPAAMNFFDDFEGPTQWVLSNGTQVNKWVVGNAVSNGGAQSLYISNNDGVSNTYTINTTSVVHAYRDIQMPAVVDEISLSFDWRTLAEACCDYIRVWIVPVTFSPTPGTLITAAASTGQQFGGNLNQQGNFVTQNFVIPAAAYSGQVVRLVFEWRNDGSVGTQPPGAIDNVNLSLITCPAPSGLAISNLTENSATFSWNSPTSVTPTFDYYISTSSASPIPGTTPTGNTAGTSVTIGDLTPSTTYYFWVRSNCNEDGTSFWIGPRTFNTPQIPAAMNFSDDFEGPNQWVLGNGTATNQWIVGNAVSNGGDQSLYITNNNGLNNAYTTAGATTVVHAYRDIQMPAVLGDMTLAFDWRGFGESSFDYMRVWIVPVSFTPTTGTLITGAASGGQQFGANFNQNANWSSENFLIDGSPYAGQIIRLIFEWRNDGSGGTQPPAAVDNVNLVVLTCPRPINLLAGTEIGSFSVDLTWTPVGSETQWEVIIQESGSGTPGVGATGFIVDSPNFTFQAQADVFYEYFVRAICSEDDISLWAGPEQFSIFIPPGCASVDVVGVNVDIFNSAVILCPEQDNCVDLSASFFGIGATTSYEVSSIDYAPPFPFLGGIQTSVNTDDVWSAAINLPFDFCFFGDVFTQAKVGSNGVVQFGNNMADGGFCPWSYTQSVPDPNFPIRNAIYGVYQDIDPNINNAIANPNINYQILGTYPCRALVVNFSEVAQFSGTCNNNPDVGSQTTQIVIYEISNIIEVYVERRVPCLTWNGGRGVIGIQNATGTEGYTPPGRNTGTWSAFDEAWRFTPNGESDVVFEWFKDGVFYSNNPEIEVCSPTDSAMEAKATYTTCNGDEIVVSKEVNIIVLNQLPETNPNDLESCSAVGQASFDLTLNNPVILTGYNPNIFLLTYYLSEANAEAGDLANAIADPENYLSDGGETIWVRIATANNGCHIVKSFQLILGELTQSITEFSLPSSICAVTNETVTPVPVEGFTTTGTFTSTPGLAINPTTGVIDVIASDAGMYEVTYTVIPSDCDEGGEFTASIEIQEVFTPILGFAYESPVCANAEENPFLELETDFTMGGVFTAASGLSINALSGVIDLTQTTPGTYEVTYTYTSEEGECAVSGSSTATITILPAGTIINTFSYSSPVCETVETAVNPNTADGFSFGGVFTAPAGLSIDAATGAIDVVSSTVGTYEVAYTIEASECSAELVSTATLTINALATPQLGFSYTTPVCSSDANPSPVLSADFTQGGVYSSSTATVDPQSGVIDLSQTPSGDHVITYTYSQNNELCIAGGSSTASITVNAAITPETGFVYDTEYCFGDASDTPLLAQDFFAGGTFTASAGVAINAQSGEITLGGLAPGTYTVTYTVAPDSSTCNLGGTSSFSFTVSGAIEVALTGECDGASYFLTAAPVSGSYIPEQATYIWRDAQGNQVGSNAPTFNVSTHVANNPVLLPSPFSVTVTYNGCQGTGTFVVNSVSCIIQRGISPNNDGDNDFFDLRGYNVRNLSIFNRYGRKVYARANYSDQWIGQSDKGDELPDGTYFYVIDFTDSEAITGWIYINREQ